MGYKTFYLLLSVITQSQPGHQTLIIIPESVHPRYDFHDKVTLEGICPLRTTYLILHYISQEAQLGESLSGGGSTAFGTSLADGQEPCTLPSQFVQSTGHQNIPPLPASNLTCYQPTPVRKGCPERKGWIVYVAPISPLWLS